MALGYDLAHKADVALSVFLSWKYPYKQFKN